MPYIMVDIEADGPIPGDYSMVCFGAVDVSNPSRVFYGQLKPISDKWIPNALKVSGFSREDTLRFPDPYITMENFEKWLKSIRNPMFISDNNGFDYMFISWYFWHFLGRNPFGHSSTNLGSLYKGLVKNVFKNFKYLRKTKHDHNPVNDAMGNVEAFHKMVEMGLKIKK
jgi:hypothetical protein